MSASIGEQEQEKDWRKLKVEFSPDLKPEELKTKQKPPRLPARGLVLEALVRVPEDRHDVFIVLSGRAAEIGVDLVWPEFGGGEGQ